MMRDIIAIGDVHGDGDRLIHALERLQLATPQGTWTGGRTGLVMMGDVLDAKERDDGRFHSDVGDVDTVRFLDKLQRSAASKGGSVTCILGNHEQMNRNGYYDYVHESDFRRYGGPAVRHGLMRGEIGRILSGWKRAHIDNNTLFCHAGINTSVADAVANREFVDRGMPGVPDSMVLEHRQYMTDSWTSEQLDKVRRMLNRLGCKQMMIGHNSVDTVTPIWNGMVVQVDACLSRAYGNSPAMNVVCVRPSGDWEQVDIRLR